MKQIFTGFGLGICIVACLGAFTPVYVGPTVTPIISSSTLNQVFTNNTFNLFSVSNVTIYDSLTVNTNVTINQNISVSGKATFNNITVTNQLQFTTNAFPLAAGSTWNFSKPYQFITTNNDFAITAIAGLSNNLINWSVIEFSNSDSATHFCDLSTLPWHLIGPNTTNKIYVSAGKVGIISGQTRGMSSSNLVTAVQP